jgi:excisionase family DNA binding protein
VSPRTSLTMKRTGTFPPADSTGPDDTDLPAPAHSERIACPVEQAVYRVEEAAVVLRMSRAATYAALRRGQIPARRVGRRWLIPRHALHTWLNATERTTPEQPQNGPASTTWGRSR